MEYIHISMTIEDHLAVVTVCRPEVLNALSSEVLSELTTVVAELELDDEVAVVILTGDGDQAFVAGADIAEMAELGPFDAQALAEMGANLGASIESSAKPWIAAVNGFALGGGCELALACDFIYASTNATFGQPEVKLGVIPGFGGTQRLARRIGISKAKELILTGSKIRADEAFRIGLVDLLVAPDELMAKARETAAKIARNGPLAVAEAKRLIHVGQSMSLESAILLEERSFGGLFDTDDQAEGMRAFLEKRPAHFQGK